MRKATWIGVDWGTSNLRVWPMDSTGAVLAEHSSDQGMNVLDPDAFEPALMALVSSYLTPDHALPVICCGMVGSRQGWAEATYRKVPCAPLSPADTTRFTAADGHLDVFILPGLMQTTPPDVMRGEETQIAGFLVENTNFDGVLCLPGTHTKWVRISAGEVVSFQTFMTGELFALLSKSSVLRHSVDTTEMDQSTFDEAISDALSRPQTVAAKLFSLRAGSLIAGLSAAKARAALSGALIGLELAGSRPYWLGQNLAIIGDETLAKLYHGALSAQGVPAEAYDAKQMTLNGLRHAFQSLGNGR